MDTEELYGLPLERFVPERTALARTLRAAGQRDEAAAVAALRKPSAAAGAVNRLVRRHPDELQALFAAGDALAAAQAEVLAGQAGGRALSEAAERERAAVSALVDATRSLLAADGGPVSSAVLERVAETLHAAALDDDAREPVQQGRLERELRHVGLGMSAGAAAPRPPATSSRTAKPGASKKAEAQARAEAEERAEAAKRAQARERAQATEEDARRQAARAAEDLEDAERAHARASEVLAEAKARLAVVRRVAKAAATAHRVAERELRRLDP